MQKWCLNIPFILIFLFVAQVVNAKGEEKLLLQADSLYQKKKYAEAQQLYFQLYQQGYSSPAAILKMAFVHEGLGQPTQALFFLSAYYNQTEDSKSYEKIQTLANARNLDGYELTDFDRLTIWLNNRMDTFLTIGVSGCLFCLALMVYCTKRKLLNAKMVTGVFSLLFLSLLFLMINLTAPSAKAIVAKPTYFMTGPSAGANFLGLVGEGHQVTFSTEKDVWIQVLWKDKEGYIKKNDLLFYR